MAQPRTKAEMADALRGKDREIAQLNTLLEAEREKWATVLTDAHDLAREHEWCSVYTEFLKEHDLDLPTSNYRVRIKGTFDFWVDLDDVADGEIEDAAYSAYDSDASIIAVLKDVENDTGNHVSLNWEVYDHEERE